MGGAESDEKGSDSDGKAKRRKTGGKDKEAKLKKRKQPEEESGGEGTGVLKLFSSFLNHCYPTENSAGLILTILPG